ncbi:MAG TPA: HEAT repeat domain-containing protein [Vicinamibacterales bacterium]
MKRFVALFIALLAGMAAAAWYYRSPAAAPARTVVRTDARWLDDLQSGSPKDEQAAAAQVEQLGTAAVPTVRRVLQDPSAPASRRSAALKACTILGPRAVEALPDVSALLQDDVYTAQAAVALSFMGSPAVQPLLDAVHSADPAVRRETLRSLGKLRERASIDPQIVLPLLFEALNDADQSVRNVAVTYLGIIRDDPRKGVPGLIRALGDESPDVRSASATALGAYGALAVSAIPALEKAEHDPDENVQREAGRALVTIEEAQKKEGRGTRDQGP